MTSDERIVLIREQVYEAERLIRHAMATLPHLRDDRAMSSLTRAADSLQDLDVLMRPAAGVPVAAGRTLERLTPR